LPKFRGGAPLPWSIIDGGTDVGSTLFRISKGIDDGAIALQVKIELGSDETVADAICKIEDGLVQKLPGCVRQLVSGTATLRPQDHAAATYAGQRLPEDGKIDWTWHARYIHDFIRAQSDPYPGAFCVSEGQKIVVLKSQMVDGVWYGTPGQLLRRSSDGVLVACGGRSALSLVKIRVNGADAEPFHFFSSLKVRL
jgi:methionyl-tRNA formyltransferase